MSACYRTGMCFAHDCPRRLARVCMHGSAETMSITMSMGSRHRLEPSHACPLLPIPAYVLMRMTIPPRTCLSPLTARCRAPFPGFPLDHACPSYGPLCAHPTPFPHHACMHCTGGLLDPVPRVHGDGVRKGGRPVQLRQGVRPSQRAGREVCKQARDA